MSFRVKVKYDTRTGYVRSYNLFQNILNCPPVGCCHFVWVSRRNGANIHLKLLSLYSLVVCEKNVHVLLTLGYSDNQKKKKKIEEK